MSKEDKKRNGRNGATGCGCVQANGRGTSGPVIECEGFTLRPWRMEDCESLAHHANNVQIYNNVRDHFPHPYTAADAVQFITMVQAAPGHTFAIEVGGQAVGGVGIVPGTDIERVSAEVGYWLGEEYWGHGIVTAATRALCDYVFANTEIVRLWAGVFAHNRASMRVLEKAGFTHLTTMRRAAIKNGVIIDLEYYELLK
ncbi:MAG: GNAT family N-acetyltransferase [Rikenellaceae bacterium]|jgi:RimJ/RimL family protein N-acetyltransferase|nr:GNAT family N-acetyltransferase [Rikenellaceae bacterium]